MSFSVLQTQHSLIPAQVLAKAFTRIERLTDNDAAVIAREAMGIILEDLTKQEAQKIQASLVSQGIESEVVDRNDLYSLPAPKKLKRCDPLAEHLVLYDALGRPKTVGWEHLVVVAAGPVSTRKLESDSQMVRDFDGQFSVERNNREVENVSFKLELLFDVEPSRYQVDATTFLYSYLGNRVTQNRFENFRLLVEDLVRYGTTAVINQGAMSLVQSESESIIYRSRRMFEREIIWLIWDTMRN
jgi:hypothetical protein